MNLELLNKRDPKEWDRVFPELNGPALQKIRWLNKAICKGQLPQETMEDLASEAVILAFKKPVQFKSVEHLVGYVVVSAGNVTRTYRKSAHGWRSIEGRFKSLDAKPGDDTKAEPSSQREGASQPRPDELAQRAEFLAIVIEVVTRANAADREIFHEKFFQNLPEREIGERHGWDTNTVGNRIKQACGRVKKLLMSDTKLSTLIKELGFEHHFDE